MGSVQGGGVWPQIRRLFDRGPVAGLTEAELLRRYAIGRDETAFEALVTLHGAMVHGVCRRMLADEADAEDAFQATFLVLVKKAGSLGPKTPVGPWLYGVACRVAMRSRSIAARRRSRERSASEAVAVAPAPAEVPTMDDRDDLAAALDREIGRLPASYRAAVVLCDLEGRTHAEAARQLGWPVGTVKGRLSRARDLLRGRLARRGLAPSAAGLLAVLESEAGASAPAGWVEMAIAAARRAASGEALAGSVSASALALAEGVIRAMRTHILKISATALAALLVVGAGVGAMGQQPAGPAEARPPRRGQDDVAKTTGPQPAPPAAVLEEAESNPKATEAARKARAREVRAAEEARKARARETLAAMAPETRRERRGQGILLRLDEELTMRFPQETPLEDVLRYIRSSTQDEEFDLPSGIPIYVDPLGLQQAEKTMQSTVSLDLEGVPLRRCLHLILRQLDLTYFVEDGLLIITSEGLNASENFRHDPTPTKPSPLRLLQEKADRGELDAAQRKELLQMLKDIREIDALLHAPRPTRPTPGPGQGQDPRAPANRQ